MNDRIAGLRCAVPFVRMYRGKVFVIKVGGEVLSDPDVLTNFAEQVTLLYQVHIDCVIVHGGGSQASELSRRLGLQVEVRDGRRVTDAETLDVAKMMFNGKLNTDLLAALQKSGAPSVGLSGVDGMIIKARRRPPVPVVDPVTGKESPVDYGYVGDIEQVNPKLLKHLMAGDFVPVISSLAVGDDGVVYNVNADTIAARLAVELGAMKLILLTKLAGVLTEPGDSTTLVSQMDMDQLDATISGGTARGGMKVKLEACRMALAGGVPRTHIISGLTTDSLLTEIFTNEGSGTLIENKVPARQEGA